MKSGYLRVALISAVTLLFGALPPAQGAAAAYSPAPSNLAARTWFENARFGMFIHWGVYSVPARGEWVMEHEHIPVARYEKFATQFDPVHFDPRAIVAIAKSAGMKYITITSKHHDGFAMWATRQSRWNIVDATPYKQDPLQMLVAEARRQGIKVFFYYSLLDWHSTDYWPLGWTGHYSGRPAAGNFNHYLDYMDAQLTELLTRYGPIGGIWFATEWAAWHLGFQPQLGAPWFVLSGIPIYPVWALFVWWFAYDAYAPVLFNEAGGIAALSGVAGCGVAVIGSLWRARQTQHVTTYGSSRWATDRDVAGAGLFEPAGVFLGRLSNQYLRHNGPEHVMAFAPTRSEIGRAHV